MEDFFYAGGVPAVMVQIADLLHSTRSRHRPDGGGEHRRCGDRQPRGDPDRAQSPARRGSGRSSCSRGNLCPDGAVMKISAAELRAAARHEGRAIVFEDVHDLAARVDDPALACDASSVHGAAQRRARWVARGCRNGATCRSRRSFCEQGVTDLLRISDARMSGTSYGAVVLHVAPESAVGGPLALVRDGDLIRLDVARAQTRPRRSTRRSSRNASGALGSRHRATTSGATGGCMPTASCRRTRAATSTFCAARRDVVEDAVTYL